MARGHIPEKYRTKRSRLRKLLTPIQRLAATVVGKKFMRKSPQNLTKMRVNLQKKLSTCNMSCKKAAKVKGSEKNDAEEAAEAKGFEKDNAKEEAENTEADSIETEI